VIRYAKGRVSANKIVLGIHLYGYDWPIDVPEAATTPTSALQRCWRIGFPHHRLSGPPTMRQWTLACFGRCGRESAPTVPPLLAYTSQLAISPLATGVASQTIIAGKALVWRQAQTLLQTHEAQLRWWEPEGRGLVGEPWFTYADGSQGVTFANADSVQLRINLARKEGLRGVIFWRLGGEDPAIWARLP
jgi:GH18 family chitinase